jgi:class 3 adenylate cyclase
MKAVYKTTAYQPKHVVGIDTSSLFVAKTGVRGANDLVWVGRAANHAAKLTALSDSYSTYISEDVYSKLNDTAKFHNGTDMWELFYASDYSKLYRSNWWWGI